MLKLLFSVLLVFGSLSANAAQLADSTWAPAVGEPTFPPGKGPRVVIDEAHHNFHTLAGRYAPFAALLEADGYQVGAWRQVFERDALAAVDVLVIANALHESVAGDWARPPRPAFTEAEEDALLDWIRAGGALLLIADHQPFPAAAADLARKLGFLFYNGFVLDTGARQAQGMVTFTRQRGTLHAHPVTDGSLGRPALSRFTVFTGQALLPLSEAQPLLELSRPHQLFLPGPDRKITPATARVSVESWLQGATRKIGRGRLAVFGEAAAFTAQVSGGERKTGMAHPLADENAVFILNTLFWLVQRP